MSTNTPSRSRGASRPRFARKFPSPSSQRAQGKPGARCTRGLVRNRVEIGGTRAYRFSGGIRLSLRGGLRLIRALLGEPCAFATVAPEKLSQELDTSLWGVGTTRLRRPLQAPSSVAPSASTASPPLVGTLRNAPLSGTGWQGYSPVLVSGKQKYFYPRGLTSLLVNRSYLPVGSLY